MKARFLLLALVILTGTTIWPPDATAGQPNSSCAPGVDLGQVRIAVGGQYRLMGNGANLRFHEQSIRSDQPRSSFANQRFRTWLNIHDRNDCQYGVYTQVEVGHTALGNNYEFPKTFVVDSIGDDVGIELRRGYLWFKPTEHSLVRAGILGWEDRFGERPTFRDPLWAVDRYDTTRSPLANSVWDFNVGGITYESTVQQTWHYGLGALVLQQGHTSITGTGGSVLFTADIDRTIGKTIWGGSAYYLRDQGGYSYGNFGGPVSTGIGFVRDSSDVWVGGRGHIEHGPATTSLFLIVNSGTVPAFNWTHTGWSAKAETAVGAGSGTTTLRFLYASGDDGANPSHSGEFRTIAQSVRDNRGAQSYWSVLGLTSPRGPSDGNDLGIGLQNSGLGLITLQAGYEHPLGNRWTSSFAGGWLRSDAINPASGSSNIGTELLAETRRQLGEYTALELGASVLFTGDFFKSIGASGPPATLYELYSRWQLEF